MEIKMNRLYILIILAAIIPCYATAVTRTVKLDGTGDYTSIQAAIDAADPGDTVLVYPGRYYENLSIQTNDINLMSLEGSTGDPAYIDSTIIDGNRLDRCINARQSNCTMRGFCVTGGLAIGAGGGISISEKASVINCKIYDNTSRTGGGINIIGAEASLSGVEIFDNYAIFLGGGLYSSRPTGHTTNIIFDPVNRCSIYNNRSGSGQDIYIQHATEDLYVPLNTFSVAEPSNYHAVYLSDDPLISNYRINFDILNAHHQEIDSDLYVSTIGDDANDGLSPASALKTIHEAIYGIAADSLYQNTVHILPGEYSRTDNDQIFPIALKSWVKVQGSGIDTTTVIGESHPQPLDNLSTQIFSANQEEAVWLADLSITSRNINRYCIAIGGAIGKLSVNFSNLRIYDIKAHETYSGMYNVIYTTLVSEPESIWDNVTIENISPAKVYLIKNLAGIPDIGEITAMKGKFSNCTFRNASSTYTSASVMGIPLISIKGDKRLEFENCVFENLSVEDDDANVIQIGGIQFPQQQNHFSFDNCLFANISSHDNMILVGSSNNPRMDFTNCTFAGNQGDAYTLKVNGEVNIVNCIFDNDTPYQIKVNPMDGNPSEHTNISIDHSLIKDGVAGILPFPVPGNTIDFLPTSISGDPLFAGGFDIHDPLYYSLSEGSPCIDAGTRDTTGLNLPPYDLAGNWRVWNDRIDMGCFEFDSRPWVSIDDPALPPPAAGITLSIYPNPIRSTSSRSSNSFIEFTLAQKPSATPKIEIYNLRGQKVKSIVGIESYNSLVHKAGLSGDVKQNGEFFSTIWNGRDDNNKPLASGIYMIRVSADGNSTVTKVTIIK